MLSFDPDQIIWREQDPEIHIIKPPPKEAGYYVVGGNWQFAIRKKPRWLSRFLMKHLLEWEWKDA